MGAVKGLVYIYACKKRIQLAKELVMLEIEQGMVALSLQEWVQLDLLADDVIQRFPESPPQCDFYSEIELVPGYYP